MKRIVIGMIGIAIGVLSIYLYQNKYCRVPSQQNGIKVVKTLDSEETKSLFRAKVGKNVDDLVGGWYCSVPYDFAVNASPLPRVFKKNKHYVWLIGAEPFGVDSSGDLLCVKSSVLPPRSYIFTVDNNMHQAVMPTPPFSFQQAIMVSTARSVSN